MRRVGSRRADSGSKQQAPRLSPPPCRPLQSCDSSPPWRASGCPGVCAAAAAAVIAHEGTKASPGPPRRFPHLSAQALRGPAPRVQLDARPRGRLHYRRSLRARPARPRGCLDDDDAEGIVQGGRLPVRPAPRLPPHHRRHGVEPVPRDPRRVEDSPVPDLGSPSATPSRCLPACPVLLQSRASRAPAPASCGSATTSPPLPR